MQAKLGQILSRVLVPGWVLTGALFKLHEASPRLLPRETILNGADTLGIDLYLLLAVLIGLEFFAVAVMLCISRLARPMAIFILSVFCLILIGEMALGNLSSCGCLGGNSPPPWMILLIDGGLLFGVVIFDPSRLIPARPPRWPIVPALVVTIGGFVLSFMTVLPAGQPKVQPPVPGPVPDGVVAPATALPPYWFASDVSEWVGKRWTEVDLFTFMDPKPSGLDSGTRYVVFYNRTCDHCEDMFREDLVDPQLAAMVTAIEVPDSKQNLRSSNAWVMPFNKAELLALPVGCDWIMTTPLTLRIVDGVVECATEGDHSECMELE
ncbi:MAG: MauE/DoxX family redox-associated membrane protein [Phycisphaerales bacterium]